MEPQASSPAGTPASAPVPARRSRVPAVLVLLAVAAAALGLVHHLLGHADRVASAKALEDLVSVRDQLLRYESERGALPETLGELVPAYLRADELERGGRPRYRYEPAARLLSEAEGFEIHGLLTYRQTPRAAELPPAEAQPVRVAQQDVESAVPLPQPELEIQPPANPVGEPAPVADPAPPLPAQWAVPRGPAFDAPPAGSLVFEAEHFTETNYAWEIHPDPECSGGAFLHCKEGVANTDGQVSHKMGFFYDYGDVREYTRLQYHVHLDAPGKYYVYARFYATDTHCSNTVHVAIDEENINGWDVHNSVPFRWQWASVGGGPHALEAGDHFFHVFIHEDGVRMDQFVLSPKPVAIDAGAFRANFKTGAGTAWQKKDGPPAHLSFDLKSMVIDPDAPPEAQAVLRRLRPATGTARLIVRVAQVIADGKCGLLLADAPVDLGSEEEVRFLPLDFSRLDLKRLPRREYTLEAELVQDGKVLARAHYPLLRPFAWQAFGPGSYLRQDRSGPLDGDGTPKPGDTRRWMPLAAASMDHFGVLDFGLHAGGNSLHAPQHKTIYARTRVNVPEDGTYLFKIQSDDQMILWIDGKEVFRYDGRAPVTRAGSWVKLPLKAGERRIRMRVNQTEARWQATLRIRTLDDQPSGVVGLEPIEDTQ